MRGEIISYDAATGTGLISGDDGQRYDFSAADIQSGAPALGQRADFAPEAGQATQIMVLAAAPTPSAAYSPAGPASPDAIDWAHLMFQFNGRIRRSHFGIAWLILFGINLIAGFIPFVGGLISLVLIWPGLAITVKRLHDMGLSGWIAAIPYGATLVGSIVAGVSVGAATLMNIQGLENEDPTAVLAAIGPAMGIMGLVLLLIVGFLLWFVFAPGQPGANRFGPNPKGE